MSQEYIGIIDAAEPIERSAQPTKWKSLLGVGAMIVGASIASTAETSDDIHSSTESYAVDAVAQSVDQAPDIKNAIVVVVDDMSDFACKDTRRFLPKTAKYFINRGTCYENATSSTPVCCPARAQIQTGQLGHNNNVMRQLDSRKLNRNHTMQHILGNQGLDTYGIGKNLNGERVESYYGPRAVYNGFKEFDFWQSYNGGPGRFDMFDDAGKPYRPSDGLNTTETSGMLMAKFLERELADEIPTEESADDEGFLIYNAFFAPHNQLAPGKDPNPRQYPNVTKKHANDKIGNFKFSPESNAKDKYKIFQKQRAPKGYYKGLYEARGRAMRDIDDQLAVAFNQLETAGELDETVVMLMSDNGYTDRGQVNWEGKAIPYPAATEIPMMAYYPGERPATVTRKVNLTDIAPTIYDLYNINPRVKVDGHSLLGNYRRKHEYGEFESEGDKLVRNESGIPTTRVPSWSYVKQGNRAYVEWYRSNGSVFRREFYRDPEMLKNVLYENHKGKSVSERQLDKFQKILRTYQECSGTIEQGSRKPCP